MTAAVITATERLRLYRTSHRIEVDHSPEWDRCDTDGVRVHLTLSRRWFHDQTELRRLEQAAAREALDAGTATFAAPDECVACHRSLPKGSEDEFLAILIADKGRLGLLCHVCQDRTVE